MEGDIAESISLIHSQMIDALSRIKRQYPEPESEHATFAELLQVTQLSGTDLHRMLHVLNVNQNYGYYNVDVVIYSMDSYLKNEAAGMLEMNSEPEGVAA